jgi:hypothetical protein
MSIEAEIVKTIEFTKEEVDLLVGLLDQVRVQNLPLQDAKDFAEKVLSLVEKIKL